ncbi:MAG: hypothetical protein J7K65_00995 [Planctomycetes bacterium]|nr:hypothetical protein [Planctomycetota bacterium]
MTKKEFIWLGVRTIGFYWLIKLALSALALTATIGVLINLILSGNSQQTHHYHAFWPIQLSYFLAALALTIYFLFYGKLVYKIISRFAKSQTEDLSKPTGYCYCEIIVRFVGLWYIGAMIGRFSLAFMNTIQSILMVYFTRPEQLQKHGISIYFLEYLGPEMLFWTALFLIPTVIIAWYFLKKGKFFIKLLNRLWLKVTDQNPVNPAV